MFSVNDMTAQPRPYLLLRYARHFHFYRFAVCHRFTAKSVLLGRCPCEYIRGFPWESTPIPLVPGLA
jgi:hypothetical protein